VKLVGIVGAVIRRDLHADQHHLGLGRFRHAQQGVQVGAGGAQLQAAQGIIGAQLNDDDIRIVLAQQRRQAGFAANGGFAADAGIDQRGIDFCCCNRCCSSATQPLPRVRPYSADRLSPSTSTVFGAE